MAEPAKKDDNPAPLPRGRHAASREVVRDSQRRRLIAAMTELAAVNGYPDTTVSHVVARAGVGKPAFYESFADKEECFIAAYDDAIDYLTAAILGAFRPDHSVEARISEVLRALLGALAADDNRARIIMIESLKAGPTAAAHISEAHRRFAGVYIASREEFRQTRPDLPPISMVRGLAIIGAVNEPITVMLREKPAEHVLEIVDELVTVMKALALAE